ncbi:hypothetical protein NBRC110019_03780 [Neptunitalea chrysea]|uniref:Uncharacterized protein n=1 Tax=Neptunitalea chrysea TaxID=1647581 RepID=A0A9W6B2X5_9FLAO|nr:hypothetical protein [Neptunitalea chrysea]GLB51339.1 hypothetical protein NBRC110019_03780 [Neptunitalea chrysea]
MTKPQTIEIFLPDRSPTSIREAEINNIAAATILGSSASGSTSWRYKNRKTFDELKRN